MKKKIKIINHSFPDGTIIAHGNKKLLKQKYSQLKPNAVIDIGYVEIKPTKRKK